MSYQKKHWKAIAAVAIVGVAATAALATWAPERIWTRPDVELESTQPS